MGSKKDFNISAEQNLQNQISAYDLKQNEVEKIWEIAKERNEKVQEAKREHKNKETYPQRVKDEVERIRADQQPDQHLRLNPPHMTRDGYIEGRARLNLERNQQGKIAQLQKEAAQKINQVLDSARNDGRGPKDYNRQGELTREFKQAHDHDRQ